MRFEFVERPVVPTSAATICRISALGTHWRVIVEAWEVRTGWQGRLVFSPDSPAPLFDPRFAPPTLRGRSQAEVLDAAHQLPERRLRELLYSFG